MTNYYLEIARNAIIFYRDELQGWLEALQQYPSLESLLPDKERILRMNLQAAKEHLAQGGGVSDGTF